MNSKFYTVLCIAIASHSMAADRKPTSVAERIFIALSVYKISPHDGKTTEQFYMEQMANRDTDEYKNWYAQLAKKHGVQQ